MVDHCSYSEGPCVPAQEGDVMTSGQTLQAAVDVFQSSLEQGVVPEHVVEVQVEQSDACGRKDTELKKTRIVSPFQTGPN